MKLVCSLFIFFSLLISYLPGSAQQPIPNQSGGFKVPYIIEGDDTIPVVNLPIINIEAEANADYLKNLQAYYRLRFNVIKVYPYARLAAVKLNEMNANMNQMKSDKERRKYRKLVEEQVRRDFEEQIKKLSIN